MSLEGVVVFGSLVLAGAISVAHAVRARSRLAQPMGPPNWDFSKSWASTFTVLSAVLGALVSGAKTLVPEKDPHLLGPAGTYAALSLAFGLVTLLAPLLYRATSANVAPAGSEPAYEGYVWAFLACTALTVWAALGQLATAALMIAEAQPAAITLGSAVVLALPFVAGAVALVVYAIRAIGWTIPVQPEDGVTYERPSRARPAAWHLL